MNWKEINRKFDYFVREKRAINTILVIGLVLWITGLITQFVVVCFLGCLLLSWSLILGLSRSFNDQEIFKK